MPENFAAFGELVQDQAPDFSAYGTPVDLSSYGEAVLETTDGPTIGAARERSLMERFKGGMESIRESFSPLIGETQNQIRQARAQLGFSQDKTDDEFLEEFPLRNLQQRGLLPALYHSSTAPSFGGALQVPKLEGKDYAAVLPKGTPIEVSQVAAGTERALAGAIDFFTTPLGVATLGTGSLPKVAQRAIAGLFATHMASSTPEIAQQLGQAVAEGDLERATEAAVSGGLNTLFVVQGARHALAPGKVKAAPPAAPRETLSPAAPAPVDEFARAPAAEPPPISDALKYVMNSMVGQRVLAPDVGVTSPALVISVDPTGLILEGGKRIGWDQAQDSGLPLAEEAPKPAPPASKPTEPVPEVKPAEPAPTPTPAPETLDFSGFGDLVETPDLFGAPPGASPKPAPAAAPDAQSLVGVPVRQVPTGQIAVKPDLMQFKKMDDAAAGLNEADKLSGDFDALKAGNLLLWEPKNPGGYGLAAGEKYIVANGHHRFDFGEGKGVKGFNSQVVREIDGVTAADARSMGAEINIADGKGTVFDQAKFIRAEAVAHGPEAAVARARRIGARGRTAATIAIDGSDDLFTSFINEQIRPEQAEVIARSAPRDASVQRVGIVRAIRGATSAEIQNFLQAVKFKTSGWGAEQLDLFGGNDAAMVEADRLAGQASAIQRKLDQEIKATDNAARNAEMAKSKGLNFNRSPDEILKENVYLRIKRAYWDNWSLHPELVREVLAADRKAIVERLQQLQRQKATGRLSPDQAREMEMLERQAGQQFIPDAEPAPAAGIIKGTAAETWADQVIAQGQARMHTGLDPELLFAYAVKGAALLEQGIHDVAEWSKRMVAEYGDQIKPHLASLRRQAEEVLVQRDPEKYGKRQFPQQVDISSDVSTDVKNQLSNRLYEKRTNESDAAAAGRIIQEQGIDAAIDSFKDDNVEMPGAVRTALGLALVKKLGVEEQLASLSKDPAGEAAAVRKQVGLLEHVTSRSTDLAQSLQAMSMWAKLTPAGHLANYRRVIDGVAQGKLGGLKPALDVIRDRFRQANEDALTDTLNSPEAQAGARQAINDAIVNNKGTHTAVIIEIAGGLGQYPEIQQPIRDKITALFAKQIKEVKSNSLWGQYSKGAIGSLVRGVEMALEGKGPAGRPELAKFTADLTAALREQINEQIKPAPGGKADVATYLQRLMTALGNREKFEEVWAATKEKLAKEYKDDPRLAQILAMDAQVISPNILRGVIADELKAMGVKISDIASGHFRGDDVAVPLRDKIVKLTGLDPAAAATLAAAIDKEFAAQVAKAKSKLVSQVERQRLTAERKEARDARRRQARSVWDREKEAVSNKLVDLIKRRGSAPGEAAGPIEEFSARLAGNLRKQLQDLLPEKARALASGKISDLQLLTEAITNVDKYQEAWDQAQFDMQRQFAADPVALLALEKFFGTVAPNPFPETVVDRVIRKQLQASRVNLGKLVRQHFTAVDAAGQTLAATLVKAGGLTGPAADRLAATIEARFKALATERKRQELAKLPALTKAKVVVRPGLSQRLIELSNLGAFSDEAFYNAVKEKMGLPVYDRAVAAEITRRANELQRTPEGFQQQRKTIELMNYIARQKGLAWHELPMSFWYANVLSGPTTHFLNTFGNVVNLSMNVAMNVVRHPLASPEIMTSLARGMGKGALEAGAVMQSGLVTGTRLQKLGPSQALEIAKFDGWATPLKAWRYVGRALAAEDLLFFKGAEEMKSAVAARILAKQEGLSGPALRQRVADILGNVESRHLAAEAQAAGEGLTGLDLKRRTNEILEQSRPDEIQQNARDYALKVTFNNEPFGMLGLIAKGVNLVTTNPLGAPLRFIVPFVNIVANVTNESLNYFPPVSVTRAALGTWWGKLDGKPVTDMEAVHDQWSKAVVGTVGLVAISALAGQYVHHADPSFMVNGAGPAGPDQRKQLMETGWIPYSFKLGGRYTTYANTPVAIPMAILGNYLDAVRYKHLDETDALNRVAYAMSIAGKVITEQSFLRGLADTFQLLQRDTTKKAGETATRTAGRVASSFVVPNALRQIDQFFDPAIYDAKTVEAILVSQVPFARRTNKPTINVLGDPVSAPPLNRFSSATRPDELWQVLAEKQAWITVPPRDTIIGDKKRGEDYYRTITPDEYYDYVQESGERIRGRLEARLDWIRDQEPARAKAYVQKIVEEERHKALRRLR